MALSVSRRRGAPRAARSGAALDRAPRTGCRAFRLGLYPWRRKSMRHDPGRHNARPVRRKGAHPSIIAAHPGCIETEALNVRDHPRPHRIAVPRRLRRAPGNCIRSAWQDRPRAARPGARHPAQVDRLSHGHRRGPDGALRRISEGRSRRGGLFSRRHPYRARSRYGHPDCTLSRCRQLKETHRGQRPHGRGRSSIPRTGSATRSRPSSKTGMCSAVARSTTSSTSR